LGAPVRALTLTGSDSVALDFRSLADDLGLGGDGLSRLVRSSLSSFCGCGGFTRDNVLVTVFAVLVSLSWQTLVPSRFAWAAGLFTSRESIRRRNHPARLRCRLPARWRAESASWSAFFVRARRHLGKVLEKNSWKQRPNWFE